MAIIIIIIIIRKLFRYSLYLAEKAPPSHPSASLVWYMKLILLRCCAEKSQRRKITIPSLMFGRVLNTVLMSIPQCKYNINFQREDQSATKENTK